MALEGLEGPVAAEATHVDAHVRAAGGEGGVVLPVHIQGGGWGVFGTKAYYTITTERQTCCIMFCNDHFFQCVDTW